MSIELIDYESLVMGKFLGSGAEGAVYAAWYQETPVAVKKTSSGSEVEMNLAAGFHDNVVALRGLCQQGAAWLTPRLCHAPAAPAQFFQEQDSTQQDLLSLATVVALLYFVYRAFAEVQNL